MDRGVARSDDASSSSVTMISLAPPPAAPGTDVSARHLRGSNLLLLGRVLALAQNRAVQVLTVRALSKEHYGAFAYALSVVAFGSTGILFGLNRALARAAPLYDESGDQARLRGAILFSNLVVGGLGAVLVLAAALLGPAFLGRWIEDDLAATLVVLLIALVPLQALDHLYQALLAALSGARALFVRRHLAAPLLRLAAVLAVIVFGGGVFALSWGYLAAGLIGLVLCVRMIHAERAAGDRVRPLLPARELMRAGLPLYTTDLIAVLRATLPIILLEKFGGTAQIAEFRAVLAVAGLNLIVLQSMAPLFTPAAARLLARGDDGALVELFRTTTVWIALLSFPVFAATCFLPRETTVLLFGESYASAAGVLAVLALGHYLNAALGLKLALLEVHGRVRSVLWVNLASTALLVALCFLLIPPFGALGAAWALTLMLLVQNLATYLGLAHGRIVELRNPGALRVHAWIALACGAAWLVASLVPYLPARIALLALITLALLRVSRSALGLERVFPELARVPLVRRLLGIH